MIMYDNEMAVAVAVAVAAKKFEHHN